MTQHLGAGTDSTGSWEEGWKEGREGKKRRDNGGRGEGRGWGGESTGKAQHLFSLVSKIGGKSAC